MRVNRRLGPVMLATVALLIGLVAACESKTDEGTPAPVASGEPIVVGSTLSL
jgi:hypothetical protein